MLLRTSATWLLLGYLALLLNAGPSAHHADFFGLHVESCSEESQHAQCCCHHHTHEKTPATGSITEMVAADAGNSQLCDCALCQYFDCFNAITTSFIFSIIDAPTRFRTAQRRSIADVASIHSKARGPPAIYAI